MPLFDIMCDECGYFFEEKLKDSKASCSTCPECGSAWTKVTWINMPSIPAPPSSPYDLLDRPIPEGPKHFSKVTLKQEKKRGSY